MSSHTFIDHSTLRWAHDSGCGDDSLDTTPSGSSMGSGGYSHRVKSGAIACNHEGDSWKSNQNVRPRADGGPSGAEGMHMNLENGYRDGQGFSNDEPVYYRFVSGSRITYWFHYGFSQTLNIGSHEGDWERIAIRLNSSNVPQEVEYYQHNTSCTLSWAEAPKTGPSQFSMVPV